MAGEKSRRQQAHSFKEQGEILERLEQDIDSRSAVRALPNVSCVTRDAESTTDDYDRPRKVPSESTSSPNHDDPGSANEGGSDENRKRSATEHDEAEVQVLEATSSSRNESLERQSRELVTAVATGGQIGHCVRTVAETSPMPDLFAQDEDGDTFLHIAVVQGDQPLTDFFIQRMKSRGIDIFNKLRQTPLHLAVITHQIHMVRKLIEGGADVNLTDRHGQTALHLACQEGDANCVYAIRDVCKMGHGDIRLELKNSQGFSVLHVATLNGNKQLIATILDMGADINEQDANSGRTPLHHAVEARKYHVAEYLISRGADANKVTFAGNTPLHTASGREMDDMVRLLMSHGANVNIANLEGDIPKVVRTSEQAKRQFQSKHTDSKRRKR